MLATAVLGLTFLRKPNHHTEGIPAPIQQTPALVVSVPASPPTRPPVTAAKPPIAAPVLAAPEKPKPAPKEKPPRSTVVDEADKGSASHVGIALSAEEIKMLILTADRLSGNGKYDQAITDYRIVLRKDPQNVEAARGLRRALQNKAQ